MELLSSPAVTGPILGPSVPAGAATGALTARQYDALNMSRAGSSRGDEEEGLIDSGKARLRQPWYKDFQVRHHFWHDGGLCM